MSVRSRFSTEPISQARTSAMATGDGDRLKTRAVSAPAKADRATPNRISTSGSRNRAAKPTTAPGRQRPGQRRQLDRARQGRQTAGDGQGRAQARRGRDAQHARLGQGIAQQSLHRRPARPRPAPTKAAISTRGRRMAHSTSPGGEAGLVKAW
jgi:hypothetical protein